MACQQCHHAHMPLYMSQNTITNAEKLLSAADVLSQTGECDPKEIYREAHELEERMHSFLAALTRRRCALDMTVSFYSHVHEVSQLYFYGTALTHFALSACRLRTVTTACSSTPLFGIASLPYTITRCELCVSVG